MLARLNGPRWAFYMREAAESVRLAQTSPTRSLRRAWLAQAVSEIERADAAARVFRGVPA